MRAHANFTTTLQDFQKIGYFTYFLKVLRCCSQIFENSPKSTIVRSTILYPNAAFSLSGTKRKQVYTTFNMKKKTSS